MQNAELTQNESGVKPPHSKKGSKLLLGGSTQNKNGIKDIGLDKQKLNTPGLTPPKPHAFVLGAGLRPRRNRRPKVSRDPGDLRSAARLGPRPATAR
jgi:hypothetical protein